MADGPVGGKSWLKITREERYFCSFLFHDIRNHDLGKIDSPFLQVIISGADKNSSLTRYLINTSILDVGYEVCLFRDAHKHGLIKPYSELLEIHNKDLRSNDYYSRIIEGLKGKEINLSKLTFDLVLWLENKSMIIGPLVDCIDFIQIAFVYDVN